MKTPERIIVSRTDAIGDTVLTLPLCGLIKEKWPNSKIIYLGKNYVRSVVELSCHIDEFVEFKDQMSKEELSDLLTSCNADTILHVFPKKEIATASRKARIAQRIGTSGRLYHWLNCTHKVKFSRKRSNLHEAQLNTRLLDPWGMNRIPKLDGLYKYYGVEQSIDQKNNRILLHPGSRGSAVDWPIDHFVKLSEMLVKSGYKVVLTGTKEEGDSFRDKFRLSNQLLDKTGAWSLKELIDEIAVSKALVACSTGPLHLAAMQNRLALGLFLDIRPIHPGRWAPIGKHVRVLTPLQSESRESIQTIAPETVFKAIQEELGTDNA